MLLRVQMCFSPFQGRFSFSRRNSQMNSMPLIFALANPDPEITPEQVATVRDDAIVATGRSDYPNQINNVLGFPYIFRGALDVRATEITEGMKMAATKAIAELAKEPVPDDVSMAYGGEQMSFGPEYIIPNLSMQEF